MSQTAETTEPTTAEGRGGGESTPATSTPSTETLERGAGDGTTSTSQSREAAPSNDQAENDASRRAYDALAQGKDVKEARTIASKAATPEADDTTTDQGGGRPNALDRPGAPAADKSPRGKAAPLTDYGGMDESSYHAMNRVTMLPPPEQWQHMPSHARGQLVAAAKAVIKARQAQFDAEQTNAAPGKGAVQQQDTTDADQGAAQADPLAGQDGAEDRPPAGKQGLGQQSPGQPAADADVEQLFSDISDYYGGDDAVVKPLRSLFSRQQEQLNQALAQKDAANSRLFGELAAFQAKAAFKDLESEIEQVKDPANQREVLKLAVTLYKDQAADEGGGIFTFGDAVVTAARAKFQPNLKQRAQQDLLQRQQAQVQGGTARVGSNANVNRAMTTEDKERAAYDALAAGRSVDETRASLR